MKTVSRFEANLLRILRGFFGRLPSDRLVTLIESETRRPECLSRNAVELVIDTLRKGMIYELARQGGWKRERFLRNGEIATGRLWTRHPAEELALSFSNEALEFLIWITANKPNGPRTKWSPDKAKLTIGDRLLLYFAMESLRGTDAAGGLMQHPAFSQNALIWLALTVDPADEKIRPPKSWDFAVWVSGPGAFVVECLQDRLAERWRQFEQEKLGIHQPDVMRRLGSRQDRLLSALFDACEAVGRRDLCRFFLIAVGRHLKMTEASGTEYQLDLKGLKLSDRMEVLESAGAVMGQTRRMDRWNREAVGTGFYDEGYTASQLWKADWEELEGDRICQEAGSRLEVNDPLRRVAGGSAKQNQSESQT